MAVDTAAVAGKAAGTAALTEAEHILERVAGSLEQVSHPAEEAGSREADHPSAP